MGSEKSRTAEQVSAEQQACEQALVDQVVASFETAKDPRLKRLTQALTRHLHAFLREVRLTEAEWASAIELAGISPSAPPGSRAGSRAR